MKSLVFVVLLCISLSYAQYYDVTGFVGNALNNLAIENVTITYQGPNGTVTVWSDASGYYYLTSLAAGVYNATAWHANYIADSKWVNVTTTIYSGDQADFYLLPPLASANSYRIVLTWGGSPSDLDSYSYTPWGCRSYYGNYDCVNASTLAALDRDDTTGYGPETITWENVTQPEGQGRWEFWVNRYSSGPFTPVGEQRAQVDLYNYASGFLYSIVIPPTFDTTLGWWRVFSLESCPQGQFITIFNTTHTDEPSDWPWNGNFTGICQGVATTGSASGGATSTAGSTAGTSASTGGSTGAEESSDATTVFVSLAVFIAALLI